MKRTRRVSSRSLGEVVYWVTFVPTCVILFWACCIFDAEAQGGGYGSQQTGSGSGYGSQQASPSYGSGANQGHGAGGASGGGYGSQKVVPQPSLEYEDFNTGQGSGYGTKEAPQYNNPVSTGGYSVPSPSQGPSGASARGDTCDLCLQRVDISCSSRCTAIKNRKSFDKCKDACAVRSCENECGYVSIEEGATPAGKENTKRVRSNSEASSCDYCMRKANKGSCPQKCRTAPDVGRCIRTCSKRQCAPKCQLPGNSIVREAPVPDAHDCQRCEQHASSSCKSKCGVDQERAGFVSCEVACIKKRCLRQCRPDLFE